MRLAALLLSSFLVLNLLANENLNEQDNFKARLKADKKEAKMVQKDAM